MTRAVFLDRDGVITRSLVQDGRPYAPVSLDDMEILPGVDEAIAALHQAGFLVIVVTNQPDVGRGLVSQDIVESMHEILRERLAIDDIKVCYHSDADGCACRKPKPGMILAAAGEWSVDLPASFVVGDRWRDVEAGRGAGCKTIWVRADYDERLPEGPDAVVDSSLDASRLILAGRV